ncbi:ABZJ_00895 family protein [Marinobacter subterrani]|uniref:ABZJ_00895 family protein n=1 Tax=Marinobacter subterrani TaxID=1658765 RepID=UPI0023575060|nr:ABZJ_00895 family protein [Marinobacter subterrani]
MIIKTVLNFTGLYAAFQLCIITIGQVFNIDMNSGVQIGAMIGAAYGAMVASVSVFGRAPTFRENWIMSVSVNICALIVSLFSLFAVLLFSPDAPSIDEFIMGIAELPFWILMTGLAVAVSVQTLLCLLIFGRVARRYLTKLSPA